MDRKKKILIIVIIALIIIVGGLLLYFLVFNKKVEKKTTSTTNNTTTKTNTALKSGSVTTTIDGKSVTYKAAYVVDGIKANISSGTYESASQDEVVFLVINGGSLTIDGSVTINDNGETSGQGDGDNYNFYGTNSAIVVVGSGSKAVINGVKINTNANGANAVFATNEGTVNIKNSTIKTSQNSSRGLDATYDGVITADKVNIATNGGSCATLATDRGEGTVTATNMTLSTAGAGSPLIYSTGNITLSDSTGTSTGAQLVVIEGKNSATVKNSKLTANGIGNRNNVDNCGVMIYQSMSGDASEGSGTFTATDSELTILSTSTVYSSAPFFFITNTSAVANLTNTTLTYGSNTLISAKGTSEWGKSGSNGGKLTLTTSNQTLTGNITTDSLSSVTASLTNSSKYSGTTSGTVTINTDSTSSKS